MVTNHHVVQGADEILVSLEDGRSYHANLLGSDPEADIAVLQPSDFKALNELGFADSDLLQQGDFVIAIGNPFGLGHTVTHGMISGLGRSGLGIEGYEDFIQTDASINPGNSGGALVNLRGELVGINTAIFSTHGSSAGIGFAIPTNMLASSVDQILEFGEVRRGQLGIIIENISSSRTAELGIDRHQRGVLIAGVQEGSAAAVGGLQVDDIVTAVDKRAVHSAAQLRNEVGQRRIGDELAISILRRGEAQILAVNVGERHTAQAQNRRPGNPETTDKVLGFLDGLTLDTETQQLQVSAVQRGSQAQRAGFQVGDVIVAANQQAVSSYKDLQAIAAGAGHSLILHLRRGETGFVVVLQS
ncbi:MAG: PDZ domain-containing protein [Halieaceae bacterium]|nr:PDZ domain-containing protein [Halieaceae bacterium]